MVVRVSLTLSSLYVGALLSLCRADINMAIQYILNCGSEVAGSCHGGSASGTYEFVKHGANAWPYDTCMNYAACSKESKEGFCADADFSCSAINTCRTCSTFTAMGGKCVEIDHYPNASIAEYGSVAGKDVRAPPPPPPQPSPSQSPSLKLH